MAKSRDKDESATKQQRILERIEAEGVRFINLSLPM